MSDNKQYRLPQELASRLDRLADVNDRTPPKELKVAVTDHLKRNEPKGKKPSK